MFNPGVPHQRINIHISRSCFRITHDWKPGTFRICFMHIQPTLQIYFTANCNILYSESALFVICISISKCLGLQAQSIFSVSACALREVTMSPYWELFGNIDERFQTVPCSCDDAGISDRGEKDQFFESTISLTSTKIAKFQCRECMNVLCLQLLVTNGETGWATALFVRQSLCFVL